MHGKISTIKLKNDYLFKRIPDETNVVRYHSLVINQLPKVLENIVISSNGGIMVFRHRYKNIRGLQFHPEAVLMDFGMDILKNGVDHNEI